MKTKLDNLKAELETMYAIELLEYHDKNQLAGDNKSRSEQTQKKLKYAMKLTDAIEEMSVGVQSPIHLVSGCSLLKDDESWEDVIAGYWLANNLNPKEEALLDDVVKYLDKEYKDVFNNR